MEPDTIKEVMRISDEVCLAFGEDIKKMSMFNASKYLITQEEGFECDFLSFPM